MPTQTVEQLWESLRRHGRMPLQQRVDATHPHDLYVDFTPPSRLGLVAVCDQRPPAPRPLRAVDVDIAQRLDGRWSLQLSLDDPSLYQVFASLCHDIVDFTRHGVAERQLGAAILSRLQHWKSLLERDPTGLSDAALRGLCGELIVLERVIATHRVRDGVVAWTGPLGTPQDFLLPSGQRIEVKSARKNARTVIINGLGQLDADENPLVLTIVRLDDAGREELDSFTPYKLIRRVSESLSSDPDALNDFQLLLCFADWHEHPRHDELTLRATAIEDHPVGQSFPRLTRAMVPNGVVDAKYTIIIPGQTPDDGEFVS